MEGERKWLRERNRREGKTSIDRKKGRPKIKKKDEKKKKRTSVREPLEDLGVRAEAQRVEPVVSRERAVEVGGRRVAWLIFSSSREGKEKEKRERESEEREETKR